MEQPDQPAPRQVTPFRVVRRGEDTVDVDDNIVFADYSAKVVPADTPDEVDIPAPKDESVPVPAPSPTSPVIDEQLTSEEIARLEAETLKAQLEDADSVPGENQSGDSKPTSSGRPKSG